MAVCRPIGTLHSCIEEACIGRTPARLYVILPIVSPAPSWLNNGMRLTRHTDYSLRVLIHLGERPERHCSIAEIAAAHGISKNHLMKVVHQLVRAGYLRSVRGRMGGVALAHRADEINVGVIVRLMECDLDLVDCASCPLVTRCRLRGILADALRAFLAHLDRYTLADLLIEQQTFDMLSPALPTPRMAGRA
ncbi:MAG: RrF2 family transcriptional regulator [Sphingomonas sp.]